MLLERCSLPISSTSDARVPGVTHAAAMADATAIRSSTAAHGGHDQFVAPAGAACDLFAAAELKIAGQADPDLVKPPAAAGNRNALGFEPRVGLCESLLDLAGRHRQG